MTLPVTAGSANQVLQTDGSGNTSWAAVAYADVSGTPTLGSLAALSSVNNSNWSGTALSIANGGTGQTTASAAFKALSPLTTQGDLLYGGVSGAGTRLAAGTSSQVLVGGSAPSWGNVPAAALPNPSASTLGGVQSASASSHQFMTGISTSGVPQFAQPVAGDVSGLGSLATLSAVNNSNWSGTQLSATNGGTGLTSCAQGTLLNASGANTWAATATPTLGVQQTTQGGLILANAAAGAYATTLQSSNSAAAAWTLTFPPTAGSANQVLKTDGSGNTSWSTVASGFTQVATQTISGTPATLDFTNLPAFKLLHIVFANVQHTNPSFAPFKMALSCNNGSSWGSSISATAAVTSAQAYGGNIGLFGGWTDPASALQTVMLLQQNTPGITDVYPAGNGNINGVRITPPAGYTFTGAGTVTIYAL